MKNKNVRKVFFFLKKKTLKKVQSVERTTNKLTSDKNLSERERERKQMYFKHGT